MKRLVLCLFTFFSCISISAISLSLSDLERIIGGNIGTASIILAQKNYYHQHDNIVEDSDSNERVYVWSENNSNYSDLSKVWLNIYVEDNGNGAISYISLQCANLEDYAKVTSDIPFLDYKFLRTSSFTRVAHINEEVQSCIYSGTKYMIETETIKKEDDKSPYWIVDLFKKGSSWDEYNGEKKIYKEDTNLLEITYTVKDGYLASEYIGYNTADYTMHPRIRITPSENRWNYETYSYADELIFKGYSSKKPIHMFERSTVAGYGTVRKYINGEWKSYTGKVNIKIAGDGWHLSIRVEPNLQ